MNRKNLLWNLLIVLIFQSQYAFPQWTRVKSPEIIVPICTYAVATKGDTFFVGTYDGTIYRSTNNGLSWTRSDSGISFLYWTYNFLITGDTIFAGTEEGVFRSTNMGEYWEVKNNGLHIGSWMIVRTLVKKDNILFGATDFGVYRYTDNSEHWYPTTGDSGFWPIYSLAMLDSVLLAGTEHGVYRSTNNGNTWQEVNAGIPIVNYLRVNTLFVDGDNVFAGTDGWGVYRSSNYGNLWLPETTGLGKMPNGYFYPTYSLAKGGSFLFVGTQNDGIYRLSSIGTSWVQINAGLPSDAYVISIGVKGNQILAATRSGLYYSSTDSIVWSPMFVEYPGRVNVGIVGSSGDNLFLGASSHSCTNGSSISGIFRSSDIGNTWIRDSVLSERYISSFRSYGDSVYAVGNGLFFSSNNGNNWAEIDSGLPYLNTLIKSNNTLFVGWGYDYWQWGESGGIFLSTNNGTSWSEIWKADTATFAIAKIGNNLFSGGLHGVFRSTNTGFNWITVNNGLPSNVEVYCFNTIENNLFACTWNGIYLSTNNGDSWSAVNNGLPIDTSGYGGPIHLLVHNNQLFAGTKNGVYISTNIGAGWSSVNNGLDGDALYIQSLSVLGNDLLVATKDGLWRRPLSEIVSVENRSEIFPKEFRLYQNFPNPFNPSTTIKFSLPQRTHVTLKVFDVLGREIATLVNEEKMPGEYSIEFDASRHVRISSGIYIYRLQTETSIMQRAMVLVK